MNTDNYHCMKVKTLISFFIIFFPIALITHAQQPGKCKIEGLVIDSTTNKPVDYASITLYSLLRDSLIMKGGTITNREGYFKVKNLAKGVYELSVSFLGYKEIRKKIIIPGSDKSIDIGKIVISPFVDTLSGVTVYATKLRIENQIDKIIYRAEMDTFPARSDGMDVLKKAPFMSIGINDEIKLKGSNKIQVLINGKPSGQYALTMQDALRLIPAVEVKYVEIITSPSIKYESSGTTGVINIITKKTRLVGLTGSNTFTTETNSGFADQVRLNLRKPKLSVNTFLHGGFTTPVFGTGYTTTKMKNNNPENNTSSVQTISNVRSGKEDHSLNIAGSAQLAYEINKKNNISASIIYATYKDLSIYQINNSSYDKFKNLISNTRNEGEDRYHTKYYLNSTFNYTKTYDKEGKELSVGYNSLYDNILSNNVQWGTNAEQSNNAQLNGETTIQVDYTNPFTSKISMEAGAKSIFRNRNSDAVVDSLNRVSNQYEPYEIRNSKLHYLENVYSLYSTLSVRLPKRYGVKMGFRLERSTVDAQFTQYKQESAADKDYFYFLPSVTLSKQFKGVNSINLSYSKNVWRPSLYYLNPYIDASNPLYITQGNPSLQPQINHNISLSYNAYTSKKSYLSVTASYQYLSKIIENVSSTKADGGMFTTYVNSGINTITNLSAYFTIDPFKFLKIETNATIGLYNWTKTIVQTTEDSKFLSGSGGLQLTFSLPKDNMISINNQLTSNSKQNIQTIYEPKPKYNFSIFWQKDLFKKKANIKLGLNDLLTLRNEGISKTKTTQFENLSISAPIQRNVSLQITYKFGKLKFLDEKVKFRNKIENNDVKEGETRKRK